MRRASGRLGAPRLLVCRASRPRRSRTPGTRRSSEGGLADAGFAFVGAAVTRGIDLAKERRAEAAQADAGRRRDLDETRRVAYMALHAGSRSRAPELVATIVNALAHHGLAVDPDIAAGHIQNLVNDMPVNRGASERWLQGQIDRITAELGS